MSMEVSSNSDFKFPREPFSPYQDVSVPLMPVGQSAWGGYFPQHTRPAATEREKYTAWRLLVDLASIAWIAPIVVAIYINANNWIVGRGVSCKSLHPNPYCRGGLFTADRHQRLVVLNEEDRAILAALQLASKALETWFAIIATSIIFSVTMHLAKSPDGIPLGYLFTHVSFPDVLGLFDKSLWTSWAGTRRRESVLRLWGFIFLVVLLCVTNNLMGPATAILIIPQINSHVITLPAKERFDETLAARSPAIANMLSECNATELATGNFNCTSIYASSLDEMSSGSKLRVEMFLRGWTPGPIITEHDAMLFTLNATQSDVGSIIVWVPNRRALSEITADLIEVEAVQGLYLPNDTSQVLATFGRKPDPVLFDHFNNTLDITLHRMSPSLGFNDVCARASRVFNYPVSVNQSVLCVNLTFPESQYMVSCSRTGSGWGDTGWTQSQFFIADVDASSKPNNVSVDVYTTDKEVLFENRDPSCEEGSFPCDWDNIFSRGVGPQADLGLTVYEYPQQLVLYSQTHSLGHHTVFCKTTAHLSFPEYVSNVFRDENPIHLVQIRAPPSNKSYNAIRFHSDWIPAAWSIEGPSDVVEATRPAAVNLVSALKSIGSPPPTANDTDHTLLAFQAQHEVMTFHAMTFVNFSTVEVLPGDLDDDPARPFLQVSKTLRVYMYDSKSPNSWFWALMQSRLKGGSHFWVDDESDRMP
ncbi:hypothetical protein B0T16DRAFT_392542 [Cercophora newfieldiana]|uniref:Uncharacterized protein n=1 Tax=Cercophora newfieldiana TaxID=92897 RepID=A0AA39Y2B8_9PEZI|nr:hypothetical protein B0T16DRAFT_392542 [Cercophora newfieldiana]